MKMSVRAIGIAAMLMLCEAAGLWAGDVAVFKNLGFSPDSRYFQFAQYGIDANTQNPWVETYTVDVIKNDFTAGGKARSTFPVGVTLGDDGLKALFAHLEKFGPQRQKWNLDYIQQGRPIYFRVTGEANSQDYDNLHVLDYKTGRQYDVVLKKVITPKGSTVSSTFFVTLDVKDKAGKVLGTYKVGSPAVVRAGVQNYTVVQMILTPNERSVVFVIEKEETDGQGGLNLRTMIETVTLAN
jgi:predicted secreted protein